MSQPVRLLIIGAGDRGKFYASFAQAHPDRALVVGVAEPREEHRRILAERRTPPVARQFADWREAAALPRFADAAVITTSDALHAAPALAFARLGYHLLLEKPMAPREEECEAIVRAVKQSGVILGVAHVLRYTAYTQALKRLLDEGAVGDIVSVEHLEPVGYWHMAHAFVRGNWRREAESSPMLLAKSCHDLDWLRYIVGRPCLAVSSFGSLRHFCREERPAGAADRCLDCGIEAQCPYSARRIYLGRLAKGHSGWPVSVLAPQPTVEKITAALRDGPYGRCVYACDNDVVDHQVVNLLFEGGRTASFTMTAFTPMTDRKTRIFGTRGQVEGDGAVLNCFDFLAEATRTIDTRVGAGALSGHGGGDERFAAAFIAAVTEGNPGRIISGPEETLETHRMVFAAERARREERVVRL